MVFGLDWGLGAYALGGGRWADADICDDQGDAGRARLAGELSGCIGVGEDIVGGSVLFLGVC